MDTRDLTSFSGFGSRCAWSTADGRSVLVRQATSTDRQAVVANISAVCVEQVYLESDSFVPTPDWEAVLSDAETGNKRRLLVVAEIETQIIGHGRVFPCGFGHKDRHVAEVGIALLKPYRQIRIGTQMLRYLVGWASLAGYEKLIAAIFADNKRALNLFVRAGFSQEGIRKRQFRIQDWYVDEVLLGRFLNNALPEK